MDPFDIVLFYLLYFYIAIPYNILIPIDNFYAIAADIGKAINPIFVTDNGIKLDVVAITTIVSFDFINVVIVLSFLYFFFGL